LRIKPEGWKLGPIIDITKGQKANRKTDTNKPTRFPYFNIKSDYFSPFNNLPGIYQMFITISYLIEAKRKRLNMQRFHISK